MRKGCFPGQSRDPAYRCWAGMKQRCLNPNRPEYPYYGGRGITMDPRWIESFMAFLEDMGPRPSGYEIDRINNNLGYFKDNCRWTSRKAQQRNVRRNVYIELGTRRVLLVDACAEFSIDYFAVYDRLKRGWTAADALSIPLNQKRPA